MKYKLTINDLLCGRWLLSMLILLLMSVAMQAEEYGLTVAGVAVTDANASNITGEGITAGSVSYSATNNTLTLNGATINGDIVSDQTSDLTVHLVGRNVINIDQHAFLMMGSNKLKFTAANGAVLLTDATSDEAFAYSVGDESYIELGYYDLPAGYKVSYDAELKRSIGEYYGIGVYAFINDASYLGPQLVTSANCDRLAGAYDETTDTWDNSTITLSYDDSKKMVTLNNMNLESGNDCYLFRIDESNAKNLTINLIGDNKLRQFDGEYGMGFTTNDYDDETVTITTDPENPGTLTMVGLPSDYSESTVMQAVVSYQNGLAYSVDEDGIRYIMFSETNSGYGLQVAGVTVNANNAENVLGDDDATVSFDAETNTLTLNNARIEAYDKGAIVSGLDNLTVFLVGENCIYGGSPTFGKTSDVEEATITFTTDRESNGSLFINNMEDYLFGEGVTPEYSNVSIKHEGGSPSDSHTIDGRLGISVGDVDITMSNADDVLGDGTVSYDVESNTLTLNGATIGNGGSDLEPMEACGIEYTGAADLTISLKGTNTINGTGGCEAIRCDAYGLEITPKLIFTKGDNQACSLQLNTVSTDEEGPTVISGFSAIEGVWGIGDTEDNGLAFIADNLLKYSQEDGLQKETVVNYIVKYVPLTSTQIVSYYGLTVAGVPVYEGNKDNIEGSGISGNGSASFVPTTNTLTLNNVNLNPDYGQNEDVDVCIVTSLAQLNVNLIGESQAYAIKATNEDCQLTFMSAEENRGAARLNFWNSASPYFIGFGEGNVTYDDGLCLREDWYNSSFSNIVALYIPQVVTNEKERGLYYPDYEFTFSLEEEVDGFDIYYANMLGGDPVKTTDGTFTLGVGNYVIRAYPIYPGMDTEASRNYQFASEIYAKVIEKPTFSVDNAPTYDDAITVFLNNIPEQGTNSVWDSESQDYIEMPQVWYYLNNEKTDSVRYDATKGIALTESAKVCVYILDEDSGKVVKSAPVEAEYTIIDKMQLNISYAQNSRTWASYCADENLETPEGLQAYVVTGLTEDGVSVEAIGYIPEGVGVLLKRTKEIAEPIKAKPYTGAETETPDNLLSGTTEGTAVDSETGNVYVLYNDGFTRATKGTIPAHRAYLVLAAETEAEGRLSIFEDETTALKLVNSEERIVNSEVYDLQGRKVNHSSLFTSGKATLKKGLYILNGKKQVIK